MTNAIRSGERRGAFKTQPPPIKQMIRGLGLRVLGQPLVWAAIWVVGVIVLTYLVDQELHKLQVVWLDSTQRIQRLEDHLEQIEYYLSEDELNAIKEQLPE